MHLLLSSSFPNVIDSSECKEVRKPWLAKHNKCSMVFLNVWINFKIHRNICFSIYFIFENSKLKTSEFGVRKGSLTKKLPAEKMGAQVVPRIYLKKVQSSDFFYVWGSGNGRGCFCKNRAIRIPLVISMSVGKTKQELLA